MDIVYWSSTMWYVKGDYCYNNIITLYYYFVSQISSFYDPRYTGYQEFATYHLNDQRASPGMLIESIINFPNRDFYIYISRPWLKIIVRLYRCIVHL